MNKPEQGYQEIEHTADLALHVWAKNIPDLFVMASKGMIKLLDFQIDNDHKVQRIIELDANDNETLLVVFLNEILYFSQNEDLCFKSIELIIGEGKLKGICTGAKIIDRNKDIKAVTFHNLEIINKDGIFSVDLVFDV